jgi:hypothetical protein
MTEFQKKRIAYFAKACKAYEWVRLGPSDAEMFEQNVDKLKERIKELEDGIRYIAKDMAALETDCGIDQCDKYVMKAKKIMGWTKDV